MDVSWPGCAGARAAEDGAHAEHGPPRFETVYAELCGQLPARARSLGVPEAAIDDVVQDTFLVVHRRLGDFEGRSSIKTWVYGILLRVVSDWHRTRRRKGWLVSIFEVAPDGELPDSRSSDPLAGAERAEGLAVVARLLDELDDAKRAVFVLAELGQRTAPEIAETLGVPVNTVYSRLRAGRAGFDRALGRLRARERVGVARQRDTIATDA